MSTLIVLNNTTPAITPTGCGGGVANITTPVNIDMTVGGAAGSTPIAGSGAGTSSGTAVYYIGNTGNYNGLNLAGGTWTVPINLNTTTKPLTLDSIFISRANSSGAWQQTIGSSTGLSAALSLGAQSFNVTGSAVTFSTGDVVVISFQLHTTATGVGFQITPDQTVTAPGPAGSVLPPRAVRTMRPARSMRGQAYYERPPLKAAATTAKGIWPPHVVRRDYRRRGFVWLGRSSVFKGAARVLKPLIIGRDARREAQVYKTRNFHAVPAPAPTGAVSGARIVFKRGPLATIPTGSSGEPLWTTDSNQLFIGDGYANHKLASVVSAPVTSTSAGYPGQIATDGTYLYICIGTNSWKRISLTSF